MGIMKLRIAAAAALLASAVVTAATEGTSFAGSCSSPHMCVARGALGGT